VTRNKFRILWNLRGEYQDNITVHVVEKVRDYAGRLGIISDGWNCFRCYEFWVNLVFVLVEM